MVLVRFDSGRTMMAGVRHPVRWRRRCAVEPGTRAALVCLCNFSPVVGKDHRVGLPRAGRWVEVLNTDDAAYGGSDVPDMGVVGAEALGWVGQPASARMTLPPLATVWLTPS